MARNARVPNSSSGRSSHQLPVSFRPNGGVTAMPIISTACPIAVTMLTPTRAATTVHTGAGDSRTRRSSCFLRQLTIVSAAPNVADVATPHESMPPAMNWMGCSDSSSTCGPVQRVPRRVGPSRRRWRGRRPTAGRPGSWPT